MYLQRSNFLSYNASLSFIVLKRGYGKTYAMKTYVFDYYLKTGRRFIWCRRNKPELKDAKSKFFTDIPQPYKGHTFKIKGNDILCDDKLMGYFIPLSTTIGKKSVPYNDVDILVYDELIPEGGYSRYLPDEPSVFSAFMTSVFRERKMRTFIMGNMWTSVTPYNMYFNIPPFNGNVYLPDRKILLYCSDRNDIVEPEYEESDIGHVLKGTRYYDYAFKNASMTDENSFITKRDKQLMQLFIINIEGRDIGCFADYRKSRLIMDLKCDTSTRKKFSLDAQNLQESYFLFTRSMYYGNMLRDMIRNGRMFYASMECKMLCTQLVQFLT